MKKLLILLLAISASASAQVVKSLSAANQCIEIGALGQATIGISVAGTFSATLQPQGTILGQAAFNVQVQASTSTTLVNTITSPGGYVSAVAGWSTFKICVSAYTSGTVVVYLNASQNELGSTIGGGGGGAAAFNTITSGTNTTAAMVVGTGASLGVSGSGTIAATSVPFSGVTAGNNLNALTIGNTGSLSTLGNGTIIATTLSSVGVGGTVNLADATHGGPYSLRFANFTGIGWWDSAGGDWVLGSVPQVEDIFAIKQSTTLGSRSILAGASVCFGFTNSADFTAANDMGQDSLLCRTGVGTAKYVSGNSSGGALGTLNTNLLSTLVTSTKFNSATTCASTGTSANPSLVACGAAAAGLFSCAVAASTGTCVISTTAVLASSSILIQPSAALGATIGVTCNTAPTLVPTILEASRVAGTSFTINMPTITVNPECLQFIIFN